jgi:gliding motility-associated protein GldL
MAKLYGMGATVVIIGALFKINHWPGGSLVITLGLLVEALIFFFSSFEPLHEELDWTLVYPELAGMSDPDEIENFKEKGYDAGSRPTEKIDDILSGAGVDNEVMEKLGKGFNQLGESAAAMADIAGATVATKEFVSHMQSASSSIGGLNETYNSSADSLKESVTSLSSAYFETADAVKKSGGEIVNSYKEIADTLRGGSSSIVQGNKEYENQLTLLSKNLADLNSVYTNQIKETSEQMKGSQVLYSGLTDMINNLKASVDETNRYKDEISKLKENISSLNNIYGNMLNAMTTKKK